MIKLKEAVIVEGKYDKIRLENIIDAVIIPVNGFHIFKDAEAISLIRYYAYETGIIIMTDSDTAGFKIRNYIKNCIQNFKSPQAASASPRIINVYTPDIFGKERRKVSPSKEGKLGVEGISDDILLMMLKKSGVVADTTAQKSPDEMITKADLYLWGLSGQSDAQSRRRALQKKLGLPELLSSGALVDVLNTRFTKSEFEKYIPDGDS